MVRNPLRTAELIQNMVDEFDLDAGDCTFFTEAATGNFAVTAVIAAVAGAEKVYAYAENSSYGSATEAFNTVANLATILDCEDQITYVEKILPENIQSADVITNTGFVRPIDENVIGWLRKPAAVPLMYEPWEYRESDLSLRHLWQAGIPVLGTDESDRRVRTQQYVGLLAPKLSLQADIEVLDASYLVFGDGTMAKEAVRALENLGGSAQRISPELPTADIPTVSEFDAVVIVDHKYNNQIIGTEGKLCINQFAPAGGTEILHICGRVETGNIKSANIPITPNEVAEEKYMSVNAGDLGPAPVVRLHTAGLAVGVDLYEGLKKNKSLVETTNNVSNRSYAADFSDEIKSKFGYPV